MSFVPRAAPVIAGSNWRRGREREASFAAWSANQVLELFDGSHEVAIRLTVQPSKLRDNGDKRFSN